MFPSKYAGFCKVCGTRYTVGALITRTATGQYVHANCAQRSAPPRKAQPAPLSAAGLDFAGVISAAELVAEQPAAKRAPFAPSKYQAAIFDWIVFGSGHAVVEAVAGSGKTTTCEHAVDYLPVAVAFNRGLITEVEARDYLSGERELTPAVAETFVRGTAVGFFAFNKHIATELGARLPDWCYVATLHSLGYANLKAAFGRVEVDERQRWESLFAPFADLKMPARIDYNVSAEQRAAIRNRRNNCKRLVALTKATLTDPSDVTAVEALSTYYGLDLDADHDRLIEILPLIIAGSTESHAVIDFDDMQYLPVALNLPLRKFDYLFVDEAQDLNANQAEFIMRSLKAGGRIIAVGDRKQSLYGFRGANVDAIPELVRVLNATVLPLSITYRCPVSHVRLAKEIVPQIEAREGAPEGEVAEVTEAIMQQRVGLGDMIICRTNAPLVAYAFGLIKKGIKATIRGKDIGNNLAELAEKLAAGAIDMQTFFDRLAEYSTVELARLERRNAPDAQVSALIDKVDVLHAVAHEVDDPAKVAEKINSIFSDDKAEIVLSSVHRAKGLESNNVWIVRPDLMPFPRAQQDWEIEQEMNIKYVALTRSKSNLFFVL